MTAPQKIEPDPGRTTTITLGDSDQPTPPTFEIYVPRMRTTNRLMALLDQLQQLGEHTSLTDANRLMNEIIGAVRPLLAGWRNVTDERGAPIDFDPERLEDVISEGDVSALAAEIYGVAMLSSSAKKAYGSPSTANSTTPPTPEVQADPASHPSTSSAPTAPAGDAPPQPAPNPEAQLPGAQLPGAQLPGAQLPGAVTGGESPSELTSSISG